MNEPLLEGISGASPNAFPQPQVAPRRSRWLSRLLILLVIGLVMAVGLTLLVGSLNSVAPVNLSIDGQEFTHGLDFGNMPPAHKVVLAALILVALLAAMVVVPLALMLALMAVLGSLLLIVGLPLVAVVAALALLLSPFILLVWLVWKMVGA